VGRYFAIEDILYLPIADSKASFGGRLCFYLFKSYIYDLYGRLAKFAHFSDVATSISIFCAPIGQIPTDDGLFAWRSLAYFS
jgi:hypothetical protein